MSNSTRNGVTSSFVTQPQRNGTPDPTRPDPVFLPDVVCGSWASQVQIVKAVTPEAASIGLGASR